MCTLRQEVQKIEFMAARIMYGGVHELRTNRHAQIEVRHTRMILLQTGELLHIRVRYGEYCHMTVFAMFVCKSIHHGRKADKSTHRPWRIQFLLFIYYCIPRWNMSQRHTNPCRLSAEFHHAAQVLCQSTVTIEIHGQYRTIGRDASRSGKFQRASCRKEIAVAHLSGKRGLIDFINRDRVRNSLYHLIDTSFSTLKEAFEFNPVHGPETPIPWRGQRICADPDDAIVCSPVQAMTSNVTGWRYVVKIRRGRRDGPLWRRSRRRNAPCLATSDPRGGRRYLPGQAAGAPADGESDRGQVGVLGHQRAVGPDGCGATARQAFRPLRFRGGRLRVESGLSTRPEGPAEKDRPIFQAAPACRADFPLTADLRDFGRFMNRPEITSGVRIMAAAHFLSTLAGGRGYLMRRAMRGSRVSRSPSPSRFTNRTMTARQIPG